MKTLCKPRTTPASPILFVFSSSSYGRPGGRVLSSMLSRELLDPLLCCASSVAMNAYGAQDVIIQGMPTIAVMNAAVPGDDIKTVLNMHTAKRKCDSSHRYRRVRPGTRSFPRKRVEECQNVPYLEVGGGGSKGLSFVKTSSAFCDGATTSSGSTRLPTKATTAFKK